MLLTQTASAHKLNQHNRLRTNQQGIFDKMIEMATAEDKSAEDKHTATLRKQNQLVEAEKEHDVLVKEEEEEDQKHQEEIED